MDSTLLNITTGVITVVIPVVAGFAVELIHRKIGSAKMQELDALAAKAVRFAEQTYSNLGGAKKYEQAAKWLTNTAVAHGLAVTETEVKGFIESALKEAKLSFGDDWKKEEATPVVKTPTIDVDKLKNQVVSAITQGLTDQGISTDTKTDTSTTSTESTASTPAATTPTADTAQNATPAAATSAADPAQAASAVATTATPAAANNTAAPATPTA